MLRGAGTFYSPSVAVQNFIVLVVDSKRLYKEKIQDYRIAPYFPKVFYLKLWSVSIVDSI